jgi:hypothetical protein
MIASPLAGNILGADGSQFVIAEWRDAGGVPAQKSFIAPTHLHRSDDEAWYVLEGTLGFRVGDDEVEAGPGDAVFVPSFFTGNLINRFGATTVMAWGVALMLAGEAPRRDRRRVPVDSGQR